jgi:hypothetical protein
MVQTGTGRHEELLRDCGRKQKHGDSLSSEMYNARRKRKSKLVSSFVSSYPICDELHQKQILNLL